MVPNIWFDFDNFNSLFQICNNKIVIMILWQSERLIQFLVFIWIYANSHNLKGNMIKTGFSI